MNSGRPLSVRLNVLRGVALGLGLLFVVLAIRYAVWRAWPTAPVGAVLIYEVDAELERDRSAVDMEKVVAAVHRRLNPGWTKRARVRLLGDGRIEIGVFGDDPEVVRRIERMVESAGTIEFRILANDRDHGPLIEQARQLEAAQLRDAGGSLLAWWVPVAPGREGDFASYSEIAARKRTFRGRQLTEILVVKDIFDVTGEYLRAARAGGGPAVDKGLPVVTVIVGADDDLGKAIAVHIAGRAHRVAKLGVDMVAVDVPVGVARGAVGSQP